MSDQTTGTIRRGFTFSGGAVMLWASAFVLAALVMLQAQRVVGSTAKAETVSKTGSITTLTVTGPADDALFVLDERSELLFVFQANQRGVEMKQKIELSTLFRDARRAAGGG